MFSLSQTLNSLHIDHKQLLYLSMLVGTDFNMGGIKGIGQKNALKLVKTHQDPNELFLHVGWKNHFEYPWQEVYETLTNIPVVSSYTLTWSPPDVGMIKKILIENHGFSQDRINGNLSSLIKAANPSQKGLHHFF